MEDIREVVESARLLLMLMLVDEDNPKLQFSEETSAEMVEAVVGEEELSDERLNALFEAMVAEQPWVGDDANWEENLEALVQHVKQDRTWAKGLPDMEVLENGGSLEEAYRRANESEVTEPDYDEPRLDAPALMIALLAGDWLYFDEDEIVWNGKRHEMQGIHISEAGVENLLDFVNSHVPGFESFEDLVARFASYMNLLEQDEALTMPRSMVAPAVRKALPPGPLTGMTFASLAGCGGAFWFTLEGENEYLFSYDLRLAATIPSFSSLVARMIWDLRQADDSSKGKPFQIRFNLVDVVEANEYFSHTQTGLERVREMPRRMVVEERPVVSLPQPAKKPAKKGQFDPEKLSSYFTEKFVQTFGLEDVDADLEQASLANVQMRSDDQGNVRDFADMMIGRIHPIVEFRKRDVLWRGDHHELNDVNLCSAQPFISDQLRFLRKDFTEEIKDLRQMQLNFAQAMATLEMDEDLVVPRELVSPFVSAVLPDGPITGMSLAVLFAQRGVISVFKYGDRYSVTVDPYVCRAVPSFPALVMRAIWDLRQLSDELRSKPFKVEMMTDGRLGTMETRSRGVKPLYPYPDWMKGARRAITVKEPPVIELPEVPGEPEGQACEDGADGARLDVPAFVIALMAQDWLFFREDGIKWAGTRHTVSGIQVNVEKKDKLVSFANKHVKGFKNEKEVVKYFESFLKGLEKDKGLLVPEKWIAKPLRAGLPYSGRLTGMVLASFASYGAAISVSTPAKNEYEVTYDGRLAAGIPSFFNLVARMLWDLREMVDSSKGRPFKVSFREVNHAATDIYLPQVDAPVKGAQPCPGTMEVKEPPEIVLE